MTWTHTIDIIFFALLLRFLMGWLLANRRVARLIITLLSLAIFVIIVNRLRLPLTKTLTSAISIPLAFILILIFLPDLRQAFQKNRLNQFFSLFRTEKISIDHSLVDALIELARIRCGALIVIPGVQNIHTSISGGEEYDARMTKSLLLSLFNPKAPRHDGAIVVQRNRIVHVGAVLPLSQAKRADEAWGTRHLAALGLTEQSDATTIVVSEERGTISVANGGRMKVLESHSPEAISDEIAHTLYPETNIDFKKKALIFSLGLWVAAFFIATVAFTVTYWLDRPLSRVTTDEVVIIAQAPIHFKNIPENLYLSDYSADLCRIYLRVQAEGENVLTPAFEMTVDLSNYPAGASEIQFTERMLSTHMPSGGSSTWSISRFNPESLRLTLAEAREIVLSVVPQFTALTSALTISSSSVKPPALKALIKDNLPDKGRIINTLPINLSRIAQAGEYHYESFLDLPPSVRLLNGEAEKRVFVDILVESVP